MDVHVTVELTNAKPFLSSMPDPRLGRLEVRAVPCPECGALAFERCVGSRGQRRISNHQSRVNAASA